MSLYRSLISNLPEVGAPSQRRLSFKEKFKWTSVIIIAFFVLGVIPLYGLGENALAQFEFLSIILGASFGSIISLGIGPIVTASIVLQLLNGAGIVKFDLTSHEGKQLFQGTQKLLAIAFIIFEAFIYVFLGGLAPPQTINGLSIVGTSTYLSLEFLLVFQLILGGFLILFMDEVISKWGFSSGISLFIAAGVSKEIFIQAFSWLPVPGSEGVTEFAAGKVLQLFQGVLSGQPSVSVLAGSAIISTIIIFAMAVYAQAMKVEIPLSFGRIRGQGVRWPLNFIYTSNIPVILVSALLANLQLWARLLQNWAESSGSGIVNFISNTFGTLGTSGAPESGFVYWVSIPGGRSGLLGTIIEQGTIFIDYHYYLQGFFYFIILLAGCVLFSYFWVQTSGMDAKSQAKQMMSSGLQIPGFRKDQRVLERILDRYIGPLTIMGGLTIGILAGVADLLGSLSNGTSILLSVMIIYRLYEEIAKQHMMDMHPMMRKFIE